jgi:hypothetical protein
VVIDENDSPDAVKEKLDKVLKQNEKMLSTNRQLFERAKKAEGFEKDATGNWIKVAEKPEKKSEVKKAKQSDEIDYGKRAFLLASGIKLDEIEFFEEQVKTSGIQEPEKLLVNPYFQGALKDYRDKAESLKATPSGGRAGVGENLSSKPEYWINKGQLPPNTPENQELRSAIVAERIRRATSPGQFTDTPVVRGHNIQ